MFSLNTSLAIIFAEKSKEEKKGILNPSNSSNITGVSFLSKNQTGVFSSHIEKVSR